MYWADVMVPKRENGQAANRRLTPCIMLASLFHHERHSVHVHAGPGRIAQSLTCLATIVNLTADPGVASSIQAWSHTFVEIDHNFYCHSHPFRTSAKSFMKGCCQLQAKVCALITG